MSFLPFRTDVLYLIVQLNGENLGMIGIVFRPHLSKSLGQRGRLSKKSIPFESDTLQLTGLVIRPGHSRVIEKKITTGEEIGAIDELEKISLSSIDPA